MSINSNNIDKWLFDYYEGNLSPDDIRKLEQFLKKNPEYYEDADAWKNSFVEESVPAFSSAFLVKDVEPSGNRKKLAYAALLLLLIGASLAIYYIVPSTSSGSDATGQASDLNVSNKKVNASNGSTFSADHTISYTAVSSHENNAGSNDQAVAVTDVQNNETEKENDAVMASLSFTPEIDRLQEMANNYYQANLNKTQNTSFNQPDFVNRSRSSNQHNNNEANNNTGVTVNNHQGNVPSNEINDPAVLANNPAANNQEEHSTVEPTLANANAENNVSGTNAENNQGAVVDDQQVQDNQASQELFAQALRELAEDINLTIENNEASNKETKADHHKDNKAITTENHNKDNKTAVNDHPSELNPDVLLAKAQKEEDKNKAVDIDNNNKTKILPPKGLSFTNRRQVALLQGINSEFENNAAFITQHHIIDAYMGVRFNNASPIEKGAGQMIGFSQYFRKARTTVNAYGFHDKTGYIGQSGMTIQMATQFKIDRYQSIIPSLSVNATQYKFDHRPMEVNTFLPVSEDDIPSYSSGLLTGTPTYHAFENTTKMNMSVGALYHHKKFFAGLSLNGLLQPKLKYEMNDRTYTATNYATVNFVAGTDFISKKYPELSLSPQFGITVRNLEADFSGGAVLRYKSLGVGAGLSSTGALNTYLGYTHRTFSLQYRFMYDKLDAPFKGLNGHYLSAHFNLKSFVKKQKPILDREK